MNKYFVVSFTVFVFLTIGIICGHNSFLASEEKIQKEEENMNKGDYENIVQVILETIQKNPDQSAALIVFAREKEIIDGKKLHQLLIEKDKRLAQKYLTLLRENPLSKWEDAAKYSSNLAELLSIKFDRISKVEKDFTLEEIGTSQEEIDQLCKRSHIKSAQFHLDDLRKGSDLKFGLIQINDLLKNIKEGTLTFEEVGTNQEELDQLLKKSYRICPISTRLYKKMYC